MRGPDRGGLMFQGKAAQRNPPSQTAAPASCQICGKQHADRPAPAFTRVASATRYVLDDNHLKITQPGRTTTDRAAVLADGTVLEGFGLGAEGQAVGEVCFNTAMTGYEEILTDPSYAGQLITFTFPHIGNVGTNDEDIETVNMAATPGARGVILRAAITDPSNYRASQDLDQWLKARGIIGLSGIDTRA